MNGSRARERLQPKKALKKGKNELIIGMKLRQPIAQKRVQLPRFAKKNTDGEVHLSLHPAPPTLGKPETTAASRHDIYSHMCLCGTCGVPLRPAACCFDLLSSRWHSLASPTAFQCPPWAPCARFVEARSSHAWRFLTIRPKKAIIHTLMMTTTSLEVRWLHPFQN